MPCIANSAIRQTDRSEPAAVIGPAPAHRCVWREADEQGCGWSGDESLDERGGWTRAAPTFRHQQVVSRLNRLFGPVEEAGHGVAVLGPFDVVFDLHNMTLPDFLFVRTERRAILTDTGCHGAPDLIVEIVSPTSIERGWQDKFATYQRFGVRSYWIIDLTDQRLHRFDLVDTRYVERPPLQAGDALTSPRSPGISLDVARLFPGEPARERPAAPARMPVAPAPAMDPPLPVDPAEVARLEDQHRRRQPARERDGEDAAGAKAERQWALHTPRQGAGDMARGWNG